MHDVTLKPDGQLVVRSDNQPAYRLVPLHGRRFRIAEPKGYSVEFRGDTTIKEVIFHQPNGTFVAARVEVGRVWVHERDLHHIHPLQAVW